MAARFAPDDWERRAEIVGRAEELRARDEPLADADADAYNPNAGELIVSAAAGWEFADLGGRHHAGGGTHGSLSPATPRCRCSRSAWK